MKTLGAVRSTVALGYLFINEFPDLATLMAHFTCPQILLYEMYPPSKVRLLRESITCLSTLLLKKVFTHLQLIDLVVKETVSFPFQVP